MSQPEPRVERFITREERRRHSPMTGADWRGSMRYSGVALDFAIRDLSRALGWRRLIRRVNRALAGTWLDFGPR